MPPVNAYPNRLRTMFKALVDNAIDAMNAKGWNQRELRVTTRGSNGSVVVHHRGCRARDSKCAAAESI